MTDPRQALAALRHAHPRTVAHARRYAVLCAGSPVRHFRLDEVVGAVWCEFVDYGTPGVWMPPGSAVLRVWVRDHEDADEVLAKVETYRPAGVIVVPVVQIATRWHYARAWWRWTWARLAARFR